MQHAISSLSHIITLEGYSEFIYSVSLKQNVLDDCMLNVIPSALHYGTKSNKYNLGST